MTTTITWPNGTTESLEEGRERATRMVGSGWRCIVSNLIDDLAAMDWNGELHQVKEKFGGLRFYTGGLTEAQQLRITSAESDSYKTCEKCGEPGCPNRTGWITTLCDTCRSGHA
jgi:hypothetical protein